MPLWCQEEKQAPMSKHVNNTELQRPGCDYLLSLVQEIMGSLISLVYVTHSSMVVISKE